MVIYYVIRLRNQADMKTELSSNETITRSGVASLQRGAETVGGKLYLTSHRLIFESHSFNIQTGATIISLAEISQTATCWTKFLNLFPIVPNSLAVLTSSGEKRFVLFGRKKWKLAIDRQMKQAG